MKQCLVLALALGALSMLPADAHAAPILRTNAKVLAVSIRADAVGLFGTMAVLQIDFDLGPNSLGQGCTNPKRGTFWVVQADPQRDFKAMSMESIRQIAMSALLSGRKVNVETTQCLSDGAALISWIGTF